MPEQNLREIFGQLEEYVGDALAVERVRSRLSQKELAEKLGKTEEYIKSLEDRGNHQPISFEELGTFCQAIDCTLVQVLRVANFLKENTGRPDVEIYKGIMDDCQYQLWKMEQERTKE